MTYDEDYVKTFCLLLK